MIGRTANLAIDGPLLVSYIDFHSEYRLDGHPRRKRKLVNGRAQSSETDARMIRRWRTGGTVSRPTAEQLLGRYGLAIEDFAYWCEVRSIQPTVRGELA